MKPNIILTLLSVVLFPFSVSADFHVDSIRQAIVDNDCYVDLIRQRLFPPVEIKQHGSSLYTEEINSPVLFNSVQNLPTSKDIDKTKTVGQIIINSGVSQTGAKTYDIPINCYPGINGFTPELSISYNSHRGNSVLGKGWSVSGLSAITRGNSTIYYDSISSCYSMTINDPLYLDGKRLILLENDNKTRLYQTETGNIKVRARVASDQYFTLIEAFYPNGNKARFECINGSHQVLFPISLLVDPCNNEIEYTYDNKTLQPKIKKIEYNNSSILFDYIDGRQDTLCSYIGGLKNIETDLLKSVRCFFREQEINCFTLNYTFSDDISLLNRVDFTGADNESYNPLLFYYGTGNTLTEYSISRTNLVEWYSMDDPQRLKLVRGRFDYNKSSEGIIVFQNKSPHYAYHKNSSFWHHSENKFVNTYSDNEKIFLYTSLSENYVDPIPNLTTEHGFVDIVCADIDGNQEDYIVKINNYVVNNSDYVQFTLYKANSIYGIQKVKTIAFSSNKIYVDKSGNKSIRPKHFFTGDFNGDGRTEIMAMVTHEPFGETSMPSRCIIFDLYSEKTIFENHILDYKIDFVGTEQEDSKAANDNSDKLFVLDYNGDGKSDIGHVGENGLSVYSINFGDQTSILTFRMCQDVTKKSMSGKEILPGDYNGDGLMDVMLSPSSTAASDDNKYKWDIYYSKGNGFIEHISFNGPRNTGNDSDGFYALDIDKDGFTDLISRNDSMFTTYINFHGMPNRQISTDECDSKSLLIPININVRNSTAQILFLNDGYVNKLDWKYDHNLETLLTGMSSSLGIIEHNSYDYIDTSKSIYQPGYNAVFPYTNIQEKLAVLTSVDTYLDNSAINHKLYFYENAVIHRQGLGFRGFEKIITIDGQDIITKTFDPYRHGVLTKYEDNRTTIDYQYDVNVKQNKILSINLTKKTENDKLSDLTTITGISYNKYGYPCDEYICYPDEINRYNTYTYIDNADIDSVYYLGLLTVLDTDIWDDHTECTERLRISNGPNLKPLSRFYSKLPIQVPVKIERFRYDSIGNVIREGVRPYAGNELVKTYEYDSGNLIVKETDHIGLSYKYGYNPQGLISTITDSHGGQTVISYDAFGRKKRQINPDGTFSEQTFSWSANGEPGLYRITDTASGMPQTIRFYDNLNQEIAIYIQSHDGSYRKIEKRYDYKGNLIQESLPYKGDSPLLWNTYTYDRYNRLTNLNEASGRSTEYTYNGFESTVSINGQKRTTTVNSLGHTVSVVDKAGEISYDIYTDGLPAEVNALSVSTKFNYNERRQKISKEDILSGKTTYEYDKGGNLSKEINSKGETTEYIYDSYNRLIKTITPELTSIFEYNEYGQLITSSPGKSYTYDAFGRLTNENDNDLKKTYSYNADGQIESIRYETTQELGTETYTYSNGYVTEVKFNGISIYKLEEENEFGLPVKVRTGNYIRRYSYDQYGLPLSRVFMSDDSTVLRKFDYEFEPKTSHLLIRHDNLLEGESERFQYDDLNRLIAWGYVEQAAYDELGNITFRDDIGRYVYDYVSNPYVPDFIDNWKYNHIEQEEQRISYYSFNRPQEIEEYLTCLFHYNGDYTRRHTNLYDRNIGKLLWDKYYAGDCYEHTVYPDNSYECLYLYGNYYESPVVYYKKNGDDTGDFINVFRDYLGSVSTLADETAVIDDYSYDPWGRRRVNGTVDVDCGYEKEYRILGRGFGGHEHLNMFNLINMNARLYDSTIGQFLSPDPFVADPYNSQCYNRYTYALNNPLYYVDEDGEFVHIIVGAVIGGAANLIYKACTGQINSWGDGFAAFGIGAAAGGLGAATGGAMFAVAGGMAGGAGGFLAGAASGAVSTVTSEFVLNAGNHYYFGDPWLTSGQLVTSTLSGAITGGISNGMAATYNHGNFWTGRGVHRFQPGPVRIDSAGEGYESSKTSFESSNTLYKETATSIRKTKPIQGHHIIPWGNKKWSDEYRKITDLYDLDLRKAWNVHRMPHLGRHPDAYHRWVLDNLNTIHKEAKLDKTKFMELYHEHLVNPVKANPDMLDAIYWKNKVL